MGQPIISVIVCTHNPRIDYLGRVLEGLRRQNLSYEQWEMLLIDNASDQHLADRFDISWHPNGRHVREDKLGLTPARLRGIADSSADLLVFVDDDNVLDSDYLEQGIRIAEECPFLGTWGGQYIPEFEVEPSIEIQPFLYFLVLRSFDRNSWTNVAGDWNDAYSSGAGLCVRRDVVIEYMRRTTSCELRRILDRTGQMLMSSGDFDINLTACDMGLGCGSFHSLKLTHMISSKRLTKSYILKLVYSYAFSNAVLFSARGKPPVDPLPTRLGRVIWQVRLRRQPYMRRALTWADLTGRHDGLQFSKKIQSGSSQTATAVTSPITQN